ncbi:uncharacterized protein BO88DRAFT_447363 [Aspergillus vadensis CBS 113365]|uniref:Uncharacterized protein n=1 Tax=Aspergillus vadensis (strain CBS 113365 / IMI 142717 / IBT 24658) TaxID=1448311 RepID=A0A319B106_ASPVC|nr:hypothetical protein BO88DRAFT_447363 [Aspergillus vadensis CBS 113365]PYH63870.1 hypothetical protein BO88DRAFT_447363 [Aspergillus vadensis CBS 113365]
MSSPSMSVKSIVARLLAGFSLRMDVSSTVATWLSLAVTVVGLGSIVTQFGTIIDQTDPFHTLRDVQHLGRWRFWQPHVPWYRVVKPPLVGPTVHVSRRPLAQPTGKAAWSILLNVIHPPSTTLGQPSQTGSLVSTKSPVKTEHVVTISGEPPVQLPTWDSLPRGPLTKHKLTACTVISRATLMALFTVTNARPVFRHSGASGHQAAYASYCGQWYVEWPIGDAAHVHFAAHDSHTLNKDVYPPTFEVRVDRCLRMLAGVIESPASSAPFKCAFPGRKASGRWILEHIVRGFGGAHGSRHLYNMIGGNVNEVDLLLMKPVTEDNNDYDIPELESSSTTLSLPSTESNPRHQSTTITTHSVTLHIPPHEATILNTCLDYLPWSSLSWSIHRGLRDILLAFAKPRMNHYRAQLAHTLRTTVSTHAEHLIARGWDPQFVHNGSMADLAAGAVLAGSGNSGDAVRIVTDIAAVWYEGRIKSGDGLDSIVSFDETMFWRVPHQPEEEVGGERGELSSMAVVALVKFFVLEWSVELDYQMYHDLPLELYLG